MASSSGQVVAHVPHIGPMEVEKPGGDGGPAPVAQTIVLPFDRRHSRLARD